MSQTRDLALARRAEKIVANAPGRVTASITNSTGTRTPSSPRANNSPASDGSVSTRAMVARRVARAILAGTTALAATVSFPATSSMVTFEGGQSAAIPGPSFVVTVNEFSRDQIVYDADIANGVNLALVPVSGTAEADDGATVQVRGWSSDDNGASSTGWQNFTVTGGQWSGLLVADRNDLSWYQLEARAAGGTPVRTVSRFGAGFVFFASEQSLMQYIFLAGTAADFVETIGGNGDNFQLFRILNPTDNPAPIEGPFFIRDDTPEGSPVTHAIKAMAAFFHKNAPGLKVSGLFDVKVGEGQYKTLSDSNPERNWPNIPALIETAIPGSTDIGVALVTHRYNQIEGPNMAIWQSAMWLGLNLDGTPYPGIPNPTQPLPARVSFGTFGIDHTWSEAMPGLQTGRTIIGTGYTAMAWGTRSANSFDERRRRRLMADWAAAFPDTVRIAPIPLPTTRDGSDTLHPTRFYDNGTANRARGVAYKAMFTAGLITREVPRWDNVNWTENYLEVWSDAGPAGTHARIADSNFTNFDEDIINAPGVPGEQEVLGFMDADFNRYRTEIWPYDGGDRAAYIAANGNPPPAGRVRVFPPAGQTFTGISRVFYGLGAYGDERSDFQYQIGGLLDHLAVVDMGLDGGDYGSGVYVHPHEWDSRDELAADYFMQAASYGALPVPAGFVALNQTDGSFDGSITRFDEPPAAPTALTYEMAFTYTGDRFDVLAMSKGFSGNENAARAGGYIVILDSSAPGIVAPLINSATNDVIALIDTRATGNAPPVNFQVGSDYVIRLEYERTSPAVGALRLYINGVEHHAVGLEAGASAGGVQLERDSGWLINPERNTYNGFLGYIRFWPDVGTGGDSPTSNVYAGLEVDNGALVFQTDYAI